MISYVSTGSVIAKQPTIQKFLSGSGTYTAPAGVKYLHIKMVGGGAAGGFIDAIIISPLVSYSYSVGTSGAGGTAGTSGNAGGAGGSGVIIVEEYYG